MASPSPPSSIAALSALDMTKVVPLITGGGSGIGLGLTKEFIKRGSPKAIITGRRESVLQQAVKELGGDEDGKVVYKVSDAGKADDRQALFEWIKEHHPDCNALVNNAGIQRPIPPAKDLETPWEVRAPEIEINVAGPIHLASLFIPYFLQRPATTATEPTLIVNVTSGLAYIPFAPGPVYSATKAAMHSYSMAMRYSLSETNVRMIELAPPAVQTNLGMDATGNPHDFGEPLDEFCTGVMDKLQAGEVEIGYKFSDTARLADRQTRNGMMEGLAKMMHVPKISQS